jgi:hypothetical protein
MIKDCLNFYYTPLRRLSARRKGGGSAMLPSEGAEHGVSSELLTSDLSGRRAPFDRGRLVAQRRAPKVPAGDLPDSVLFDRVQGLDASL